MKKESQIHSTLFKIMAYIVIALISICEDLLAKDIYSFLEKGNVSLRELTNDSNDLKCSYTFDLQEKGLRPTVFFIPFEKVKRNKFSALWELKELPLFLKGSTWEKRKIISGSDLVEVLNKYPQYKKEWFFYSQEKGYKAELSSISGYTLTINREIHLILNFEVEPEIKLSSAGILTNKKLHNFTVLKIIKETSVEKNKLVRKFINDSGIFNGNIKTIYQIGNNTLHIQWHDPNNEIRFERPYAVFITEVDNKLYLYRNVRTISSYKMSSGEYSETNEYIAAYDVNGDGFPEVQHRYLGRYSASDSFTSLSENGVINCGRMVLGSD